MALIQSDWATGKKNVPTGNCANELIVEFFTIDCADIAGASASDVVEIGCLPARHLLNDFWINTDVIDSDATETLQYDLGFLSGSFGDNDASRTCGADLISNSTLGQDAGAYVTDATAKALIAAIAVSDSDRGVGLNIDTAAATAATTGTFTLALEYFQT